MSRLGRRPIHRLWKWLVSEGPSSAGKEALKYSFLTITAFVNTWLLSILVRLLGVESNDPKWADIWPRLLKLWAEPSTYAWDSLVDDRVRSAKIAAVVSLAIIALFVGRKFRRAWRNARKAQVLAISAGLIARWPDAEKTDESVNWEEMKAEIMRADNNTLDILCSSGAQTFGLHTAHLYDTLQQFHGTTRILLLSHQTSDRRAQAIQASPQTYSQEIDHTIARMRVLKKIVSNIEGKQYRGLSGFKLILTSHSAWVQYYVPGARDVAKTPIWRFNIVPNGRGFFQIFQMEFNRVWNRNSNVPINLK